MDLFDDYGNFVGRFTPANSGESIIIGCLVMIFLYIIGFVLYTLFWLLKKGFSALFQGKFVHAALYLSPFLIIGFLFVSSVSYTFFTNLPTAIAQQAAANERESTIDAAEQHLTQADAATGTLVVHTTYGDVTFEKLSGLFEAEDIRSCRGYAISECEEYFLTHRGFWSYQIHIPQVYGYVILNGFGSQMLPDSFFRAHNNGYTDGRCFLEAWSEGGWPQVDVYVDIDPNYLFCEAIAEDPFELDLSMTKPGDWQSERDDFTVVLDSYTGMFVER